MLFSKIKKLRNREYGKDIYILANAPSVKEENLSKLKDEIVIGMNANPLLEKEFGFEAKYYVVSDKRFLNHPIKREMATTMIAKNTIRVLRKELEEDDDKTLSNQTYYVKSIGKNGFSFDLNKGYYFGFTTSMLAIQLASYLGAKNIYLLGMDLKYDGDKPRFYKEDSAQEFDSFTSFQIQNVRNAYLELSEKGIHLFNCSRNSLLLPYLPYDNYQDTLS